MKMKQKKVESGYDVTTIEGLTGHINWLDELRNFTDDIPELTVKQALQKNPHFRAELKRHGISWRLFKDYGFINNNSHYGCGIFIGMGKHNGVYDYKICTLNDVDAENKLTSHKEKTTREKLIELKGQLESIPEYGSVPRYSVEIGKKYAYVCHNNGAFHRGDMMGGGWATFIGRYTADDCDLV
jgi:hypothetical protein